MENAISGGQDMESAISYVKTEKSNKELNKNNTE